MEMQYIIYKQSPNIKTRSKRHMVIHQDHFYYYNHDEKNNTHNYHISELACIEILKNEGSLLLNLKFTSKDQLRITCRDNEQTKEIRDVLSILKRNYGIVVVNYLYINLFFDEYNTEELKSNMEIYTTNKSIKDINSMLKKNKEIIDSKSKIVYDKMLELGEKCINKEGLENDKNKMFEPFPRELEIKDTNILLRVLPSDIDAFSKYYKSLFKILSTIRKSEIQYRFRRGLLFNKAISNFKDTKEFQIIPLDISTTNEDEKKNEGKLIEEKSDQIYKIEALKRENKELKDTFFKFLSKHSKKKEKLKRFILTSHIKIYYCYNCGNLLRQNDSEESNCKYDERCTENSLFSCIKCKIFFCTYCIIYQRNSKCSNNHRLFPSKTPDVCLLCNDTDSKTYFKCQLCGIAVCAMCMGSRQTKEINCWNCNTELIWRKEVYVQCNKCQNVKDCFWGCSNCDYSLCLNCVQTNKGYCGAAHILDEFDTSNKWEKLSITNDAKFSQNFNLKFMGKCMKCDMIIQGKCFACLRCAYFICEGCS